MSDFAALLGQFQQSAQSLNTQTSLATESQQLPRKRARVVDKNHDAADFPPVEKIFILCPAGVQTGGPEALHQLCDQLNASTNIPAYMVYVVKSNKNTSVEFAAHAKTPLVYRDYKAPSVSYNPLQQGNKSHLLVWPECWTDEMLAYLDDYQSDESATPCAIWWLSVNNNTRKFKEWNRNDVVHLHQSEYARQHLLKNKAKHIIQMTEYISNPPVTSGNEVRTIDVLFNPLKGVHYTDGIRKRSAGATMKFQPIGGGPDGRERIPPTEVRALLKQAKIYIDFGPHPGMDRLPREAALAGCLVVTNKEGAAGYDEDVPLPPKYKIGKFDPDAIHRLLKDLLQHFDERTKDFDDYRAWIHGQHDAMKGCLDTLVDTLVTKRVGNNR